MAGSRRRVHSLRLPGYDYSLPGLYFVTFCQYDRQCLFGHVERATIEMTPYGEMVAAVWNDLPRHYHHVRLEEMVVMPNHVHGMIRLTDADLPKRQTLSEIVRAWKAYSAKVINRARRTPGAILWQRGFWDEIINSERQELTVRTYIRENPLRWELDRLHPSAP